MSAPAHHAHAPAIHILPRGQRNQQQVRHGVTYPCHAAKTGQHHATTVPATTSTSHMAQTGTNCLRRAAQAPTAGPGRRTRDPQGLIEPNLWPCKHTGLTTNTLGQAHVARQQHKASLQGSASDGSGARTFQPGCWMGNRPGWQVQRALSLAQGADVSPMQDQPS